MKNTFKTLGIIAIIAVIGFSIASCASFMDEVVMGTFREFGSSVTQTVSLVGTWADDNGLTMTFNADGTGTQQMVDIYGNRASDSKFTWKTDIDQLIMTYEDMASMPVKYSVDGNTFTMQVGDMSITRTRR